MVVVFLNEKLFRNFLFSSIMCTNGSTIYTVLFIFWDIISSITLPSMDNICLCLEIKRSCI